MKIIEGKPKLLAAFVIDESGSMSGMRKEAVSGVNEYLETLKLRDDVDVFVTLVKFNKVDVMVYEAVPVTSIPRFEDKDYSPSSATALLDAVGDTIRSTERKAAEIGVSNVLVLVVTDGQENASTEWSHDAVRALIVEKKGLGWTFAYCGAGDEAWVRSVARGMGITGQNVMAYTQTRGGYSEMTCSNMQSFKDYMGRVAGGQSVGDFYAAEDKDAKTFKDGKDDKSDKSDKSEDSK